MSNREPSPRAPPGAPKLTKREMERELMAQQMAAAASSGGRDGYDDSNGRGGDNGMAYASGRTSYDQGGSEAYYAAQVS